MNQLKHIVHSLPRHAPPSNPIGGVSSGYQIQARGLFRSGGGSDSLPRSRSCAGCGRKNGAQTLLLARQTATRYRNASTDRVGNSNLPLGSRDGGKNVAKAEAPGKNEKRAPRLTAVAMPEPRKYAKLIADYSEAIERQNLRAKSKELPTGLLSRLPIESFVASLRTFEKRPKSKRAKSNSTSIAASSNAKQSNHTLTTKNSLKSESSKNLANVKSAPQKREYFTKNCDTARFSNTEDKTKEPENKMTDVQDQCKDCSTMGNAYIPNDFDFICEVTEKYNKRKSHFAEWSHSGGIDHKVKAPSNLLDDLRLSSTTTDDNQCQFHIVASKEKIELKISPSTPNRSSSELKMSLKLQKSDFPQKSSRTRNRNRTALPWWATPESALEKKYEKAESTSTPDIKVIYSEEMTDFEIARQDDKSPSLSDKSKLKLQGKLASLSKTKQYVKEELEKQKNREKRKKNVDKLTNIDGKEVEDGNRRPKNERSDDKTAKLSKMMDRRGQSRSNNAVQRAANKKSSENNVRGIPEAWKRQPKDSIDQEYRAKRVTEPLKPLEKRKDGTLIDYGLKVPTRRPKTNQQQPVLPGEPNPQKKKEARKWKITSLRKSGENRNNNSSSGDQLTTRNCSGEAITAGGLVNGPRAEQMFSQPPPQERNCRAPSGTCAVGSTPERPEKRLIYAAWLNNTRQRTPRAFL